MLTSGRLLAELDHLAQAHAGCWEAGVVPDGVHQAFARFPRHGGSGFANWALRGMLWSYGVQHGGRERVRGRGLGRELGWLGGCLGRVDVGGFGLDFWMCQSQRCAGVGSQRDVGWDKAPLKLSEPRLAGRESNDARRDSHRRPGLHSIDGRACQCIQLRGKCRCRCRLRVVVHCLGLGVARDKSRIPEPLLLVGPRAGQLRSHCSQCPVPSAQSQCRQCSMIFGLFGTSV